MRFEITGSEIRPEEYLKDVGEGVGAVVTFMGTVRGTEGGRRVEWMHIEADVEGAILSFKRIAEEAKERFGIDDLTVVHRVGQLKVGETIVLIAALSAHREEAFSACRYAIEQLKKISPIWKKVHLEGGEEIWIENR